MAVIRVEAYSKLTESIEDTLDVADKKSDEQHTRYTHKEIFTKLREGMND